MVPASAAQLAYEILTTSQRNLVVFLTPDALLETLLQDSMDFYQSTQRVSV